MLLPKHHFSFSEYRLRRLRPEGIFFQQHHTVQMKSISSCPELSKLTPVQSICLFPTQKTFMFHSCNAVKLFCYADPNNDKIFTATVLLQ